MSDVDPAALDRLFARAEREVREGLLPSCQLALARNRKIIAQRTFCRPDRAADDTTLFGFFSCSKTVFCSAAWLLIQEGKLGLDERVADIVPEFGTNGKDAVTVEQLFTHTSGFPNAPYPQREWHDRSKRLERFSSWRLAWEPGTRFEYHPTSSLWVVAELTERRSGMDFRAFIRSRVALPLGLPDLWFGLPREHHHRVADLEMAGRAPGKEELAKRGFPDIPEGELSEKAILGFNRPGVREAGVPGGGAITTAGTLALFYQALLDGRAPDGTVLWTEATLREARRIRTGDLVDPWFRKPANRGLGIVVAGGHGAYLGFGRENSPAAFGHAGAGGQVGWADPETGLSFAYCTNGYDRDPLRQARRGVALSSLAAACARKGPKGPRSEPQASEVNGPE